MKSLKRLVAPVLGAFLLAGCAGTSDHSGHDGDMAAAAAVCVVSGEDADGGPTADYDGTTVNFCCDSCKSKWDKWDDAAKKAAVAKLK